jgi:hypothetical protein
MFDVSRTVHSNFLWKGEEEGADQGTAGVVCGSVGVTVREFELLDQRLQADGIFVDRPAASVRGHDLRIDIPNDGVDSVDLEVKILAVQMVAIVSNRVAKNDDGTIVSLESFHTRDGFIHESSEILTSLRKGDKADFTKPVASGSFRSGIGGV